MSERNRSLPLTAAFKEALDNINIEQPSLAASMIPVIGPAWEAAADFQDGDYLGAAFNTAMAVADVLPAGIAIRGARAAHKGITAMKSGSVTADAARKQMRARGFAQPGQEIHHSVPLNGLGRNVQNWRNHYAFLKPLPQEQHRRLTGSWQGRPRYDPVRRVWYGTTDWQKALPTAATARGADSAQNLTQNRAAGHNRQR